MRTLELLICLITVLIAISALLAKAAQRGVRVLCMALLVVVMAHLLKEGEHWQMWPAYIAALLLLAASWAHFPAMTQRITGVAALVLVIASVILSILLPMFRLPKPTGQYQVGTRIVHMVDTSRTDEHGQRPSGHREMMVQVWYPAQSAGQSFAAYRRRAETTRGSSYQSVLRTHSFLDAQVQPGAWPVLIFNPAWTGQRSQSTFLMEELASHGFVVAAIDHTYYSGKTEFPDGQVIDALYAPPIGNFEHATVDEQDALGAKYVDIEAEDDIFVLDQLQKMNADGASPFFGHLDTTHAGALGHSLGGAAAAEAAMRDPRILAALNMDGWTFGEAGKQGLSKPFMVMYESRETTKLSAPLPPDAPEADRRYWQMQARDTARIDASLKKYGGYRMYIEGTTHWNFSDRALYSPLRRWTDAGTIPPRRAYEIIDCYAVAFFSHYLKGTAEPVLTRVPSEFPEVDLEVSKYNFESEAAQPPLASKP